MQNLHGDQMLTAENIKFIVIFSFLGIITLLLVGYMWRGISKSGQSYEKFSAKFAEVGLHLVGELPQGAQIFDNTYPLQFIGSYQGMPAGYNQGRAAVTLYTIKIPSNQSDNPTDFQLRDFGMEFWIGENLQSPSLAIVERDDPTWNLLPPGLIPQAEVRLVDIAFDRRFIVRCDDQAWALKIITPQLRRTLLAMPLVCLIVYEGRVFFAFAFSGENIAKKLDLGAKITNESSKFLDAAYQVAHEILRHAS